MTEGIPWYIFSIVGLVVAISSYLISYTDLVLFVLTGIIIFIWGILKLCFSLLHKKNVDRREHIMAGSHTIRCDSCGVKIHSLFNYCPKCGKRHR